MSALSLRVKRGVRNVGGVPYTLHGNSMGIPGNFPLNNIQSPYTIIILGIHWESGSPIQNFFRCGVKCENSCTLLVWPIIMYNSTSYMINAMHVKPVAGPGRDPWEINCMVLKPL